MPPPVTPLVKTTTPAATCAGRPTRSGVKPRARINATLAPLIAVALIDTFLFQALVTGIVALTAALIFLFSYIAIRISKYKTAFRWGRLAMICAAAWVASLICGNLHDVLLEKGVVQLGAEMEAYRKANGQFPSSARALNSLALGQNMNANTLRIRGYLVLYLPQSADRSPSIRFDRFNHQRQTYDLQTRTFGAVEGK